MLATCTIVRYALSFDGLATKVNHHKTVSEYFTPPPELRRNGFDRLIRLAVGLEDRRRSDRRPELDPASRSTRVSADDVAALAGRAGRGPRLTPGWSTGHQKQQERAEPLVRRLTEPVFSGEFVACQKGAGPFSPLKEASNAEVEARSSRSLWSSSQPRSDWRRGARRRRPTTPRVVKAAEAFLGTLDATGRSKAQIDLNAKTRTVWSNLPSGIAMQVGAKERNGLKIGDMTPAQEKAALALLATALSKDGYQKVMQIVDADELLEQRSAPTRAATQAIRFGRKEFYFAILGKPSASDMWMLQFGGHHLAINVTYAGRASILAPTHTGAQPATYAIEGRTIRPLGDENDKAFALMNSLNADQQKQVSIGTTVRTWSSALAKTER